MADLDTRIKRESGVYGGQPWRMACPPPNGAIGQADRQVADGQYSGILASGATQTLTLNDLTTLFGGYVDDLHALTVNQPDSDTLVRDDLGTVIAAYPSDVDDYNTLYAIYLSNTVL